MIPVIFGFSQASPPPSRPLVVHPSTTTLAPPRNRPSYHHCGEGHVCEFLVLAGMMKLGFPSEATHWLCEGFNISGRKEMVRTTKVHHRNGCWDEKVARETYWTNIEFVDTACACFTLEYAKPAKQVPCRHARTGVYQLVGLFLYFGDLLTTILSGHNFLFGVLTHWSPPFVSWVLQTSSNVPRV